MHYRKLKMICLNTECNIKHKTLCYCICNVKRDNFSDSDSSGDWSRVLWHESSALYQFRERVIWNPLATDYDTRNATSLPLVIILFKSRPRLFWIAKIIVAMNW